MVRQYYTTSHSSFDIIYTNNYETLPLSEYNHLNLYINGNDHTQQKFETLYKTVENGLKITLFGGSTELSHALHNSNFLKVNPGSQSWAEALAPFITDLPYHPLLKGIEKNVSFEDKEFTPYSVRVSDPRATVVLRNSDGWPAFLTKQIGKGFFTFATLTTILNHTSSDR
ncbi:hypothetical protein P9112_008703 [Eukaryota sp. TZLM1-RC]